MDWRIIRYDIVTSTQDVAREHASSDGAPGLVVLAGAQTEGRGRRGSRWQSAEGGLYVTVVLTPGGWIGLLPFLAGVVVSDAIMEVTGIRPLLKWPNDVLIDGMKVGGVLLETAWHGDGPRFTLLGIGVNVSNRLQDDLPRATTLSRELGSDVDRERILLSILARMEHLLPFLEADPDVILREWRARSQTLGRHVEVTDASGEMVCGMAVDLDEGGALIIETADGPRRVLSGRV
ncbi:MAG: biotin--[acetyl-CoA-carboxylase] ligase [Candidatus Bathyarchaeota archaeon]|nr:MAG: biotin--[acetyl-CoA-carboxylase] ligase [Candidatus Bathyarchaeota archaeon]